MKFRIHWLAVLFVTALLPPQSRANDQPGQTVDNYMKAEITPPRAAAPVDEYIISLGRATDMDILVDVTDIGPEAHVRPYPGTPAAQHGVAQKQVGWAPNRVNCLADLANQGELSWHSPETGTALFWKEPDVVELGGLIASEIARTRTQLQSPALTRQESVTMLKNALEQSGWNGQATGTGWKVKFTDLPLELRRRTLAEMWDWLLARYSPQLWFDNEFWQQTRLEVTYEDDGRDGSVLRPHLSVAMDGSLGTRRIYSSVGSLQSVLPVQTQNIRPDRLRH